MAESVLANAALRVGQSRWLTAGLIVSFLATTALLILFLPWWAAALGASGVGAGTRYALRLHASRTALHAIVALKVNSNTCDLELANGVWLRGRVSREAFVHRHLVIAVIHAHDPKWGKRVLVLLPDAMDPGAFRALRTSLKWGLGDVTGNSDSRA